jgi:hypothetical protein
VHTPSGAQVDVVGAEVHKLHRPGTDPRALRSRLRLAAGVDCLLTPLSTEPEPVGDRWRTRWPLVEVVAPQPDGLPWLAAGAVLARLHSSSPGPGARPPGHGWPARLRRAVDRLRSHPGGRIEVVRAAAAALPPPAWRAGSPDRPRVLVHGDWHLGQLGRRDAGSPWLLIDIDDLGVGDPAWDLARPAGLWAAGLMPDADWAAFVDAYRAAGGAALPAAPGDPWPVLEPFARAAVVHAAANHPDDDLLVDACARMVSG